MDEVNGKECRRLVSLRPLLKGSYMFKILEGLETNSNSQGHKLYLVTPAWVKALDLLGGSPTGFNRNNRRYDRQKAAEYARMITAGKWNPLVGELHIVNQPDQPSHHGRLVSGQHRLMGILMADKPVWVRFTGLPLEAALHVDTGRSRSYGQNVAMFTDPTYAWDEAVVKNVVSILEYLVTGKYRSHTGASNITRVLGETIFLEVRNKWLKHFDEVRKTGISGSFNKNIVKAFLAILYASGAPSAYIDVMEKVVTTERCDEFCQDRIHSFTSKTKSPTSLMVLLGELWKHICTGSTEQGYADAMPYIDPNHLLAELGIPVNSVGGIGKGKIKKK